MKKLALMVLLVLMAQFGYSQVGINTTTPNAQLDIRSSNQVTPSNNDGILIPKIDAFPLTNPTAAQQGMLVYLTTVSAGKQPGFYYWDNTGIPQWKGFGGNAGWELTGNAGTNPATNFIGTTDATDVVFRRDNVISGKIGMANTSFGRSSLNPLNSGIYNSAFGLSSMNNNTSGNSNSAFGNYALTNNTTGNSNTAFGANVMYSNSIGQNNTAVGSSTLEYNSTGNNNSAIGYYSLYNNSIGNNNTAHGFETLLSNQTGGFNTAIGSRALRASVTGAVNTAIGDDALSKSNGADLNVAVGGSAMLENLTGSSNTAVGSGSLRNNVTANRNTAIGYEALYTNTGSENTALGYHSNILGTTGSRNITIGANANVNDPAGNDQLSIANVIYGSDLNSTATGKIGIGVPVPTEKLEVDGKTKTTNLQVTNGAGAGLVLTSDAIGNATWQTAATGNSWSTTGNSGLNAATNFIGTTDNVDLVFKRFNLFAGKIGSSNTSFGINSLANTTGANSVAIGTSALVTNTLGSGNVAVGVTSMLLNTIGSDNNAVGYGALSNNSTANKNIAIGNNALFAQSFGNGGTAYDTNNIAVGYESMFSNNPAYVSALSLFNGSNNVAIGNYTLRNNVAGRMNVAIGNRVLESGSSYFNTGVGALALNKNNGGSSNTAIGYNSLSENIVGYSNVAVGAEAMQFNRASSLNTAIGSRTLSNLSFTNGGVAFESDNIAIGYAVLSATNPTNTTNGNRNVAIGNFSMNQNTIGQRNTALGTRALQNNSTGSDNVANGDRALQGNTTGSKNIASGANALLNITTGSSNIGIGSNSMALHSFPVTGNFNVAIGEATLGYNVIGSKNVAVGDNALLYSTFCSNGVAIGSSALQYFGGYGPGADIINENVAVGFESMKGTVTGGTLVFNQNTAIGYQTLSAITSGVGNTASGYKALTANTTGSYNTTLGYSTLQNNISGSGNVAIGNEAGYNELGSNKLYIENSNSSTPLIYGEFDTDLARINGNFRVKSTSIATAEMQVKNSNLYNHPADNNLNFGTGGGYFMVSTQDASPSSETVGIRGDGDNVSIWSPGDGGRQLRILDEDAWTDNNGNPYDNAAEVAYIAPNGQYFQVSDKNKKENIAKIEDASTKISKISGYTYQYKLKQQEMDKGQKQVAASGVLAQEIEQVLPEAIQKNESGEYFVDYAAITPLLIEAIKEQNNTIKLLEERLKKLEEK